MSELNEIEKGQLCQSTIESLYEAKGGLKSFPGLLKKIIRTKAWERRVAKGKLIELGSLRELITAMPVAGWGEDIKAIENVIRDDAECLAMFREAMVEKPGKRAKTDISTNSTNKTNIRGTTKAYSISKVNKECPPEVVKQVISGEVSANKALVDAGLRKSRQFWVPEEPAKALEKLRKKFGTEFVAALVEHAAPQVSSGATIQGVVVAFNSLQEKRLKAIKEMVAGLAAHERHVLLDWLEQLQES